MATLTLTVAASADDALINDLGYIDSDTTMVVGGVGTSPGANFGQGWRFLNVTLTSADTVTSAKLQLRKSGTAWSAQDNRWTCIAEDNTATFSSGSPPGSRAIVTTIIGETPNVDEVDGTYYDFPKSGADQTSLGAAIQEVIDRAGWASGNALAIVNNSDQDASAYQDFGRKTYFSYDNGAGYEPTLVITYTAGAGGSARTSRLSLLGVS